MLNGQKIFVTGATGFIGKHLALELARTNQVTALVRGPRTDNKEKELLSSGVKIIYGNLLDNKTYASEISESDYVFHLAALFKIDAAKEELYKENVLGTKTLLECCKQDKLKRFIFFSTAYVSAGKAEKDDIAEDQPYAVEPRNWYEWSKAEAEKIVLRYYKEQNLPIVIIRPSTVYGPGSLYGWYFTFKAVSGRRIFLSDGGKNKIHFVSVYDVVRAAIHLAEKEESAGGIFNICDERPYSQKEAVILTLKIMGIKMPLISFPKNLLKRLLNIRVISTLYYGITPKVLDFYLDNHTFNNQNLKKTGFTFKLPEFKDGAEETVRWYAENKICRF